jgi:hypothetical protein
MAKNLANCVSGDERRRLVRSSQGINNFKVRYDRLLWTEGLGRKLREQVQAAFSATPSIKRTPSIS